MSVRQDPRSKKWYFRFQRNRQYYGEGGFRTHRDARDAETRLANKVDNEAFPNHRNQNLTFADAGKWFFEKHAKPNKRSWVNDRARLRVLTQYFGTKLLKKITPEDVEACLAWVSSTRKGRNGGPMSDHNRNHYLVMVKMLFNRLKKRRKYIGDNPAYYVEMKKIPRARVRFLYPEEESRLSPVVAKDQIVWPSYYVALHTGMRANEIAHIRVKDVSFVTQTIFVPNSKSSRSRHVPMSEGLSIFLQKCIARKTSNDYALSGVIRDYVSRRFRKICHQAGIADFKFHDLRSTFAARLLTKGVPIYKVSKILGHSSVVVTEQHYGHLSYADLKDAVDQIDGVIKIPVAASTASCRKVAVN